MTTRTTTVWQGSKWIRRSTRLAIYARDGFKCAYCGCRVRPGAANRGGNAQLDHIVPRERGGSNAPANLTTACTSCNAAKGGRTGAEYAATLEPAPRRAALARLVWAADVAIDRAAGRALAALEANGMAVWTRTAANAAKPAAAPPARGNTGSKRPRTRKAAAG